MNTEWQGREKERCRSGRDREEGGRAVGAVG